MVLCETSEECYESMIVIKACKFLKVKNYNAQVRTQAKLINIESIFVCCFVFGAFSSSAAIHLIVYLC